MFNGVKAAVIIVRRPRRRSSVAAAASAWIMIFQVIHAAMMLPAGGLA